MSKYQEVLTNTGKIGTKVVLEVEPDRYLEVDLEYYRQVLHKLYYKKYRIKMAYLDVIDEWEVMKEVMEKMYPKLEEEEGTITVVDFTKAIATAKYVQNPPSRSKINDKIKQGYLKKGKNGLLHQKQLEVILQNYVIKGAGMQIVVEEGRDANGKPIYKTHPQELRLKGSAKPNQQYIAMMEAIVSPIGQALIEEYKNQKEKLR